MHAFPFIERTHKPVKFFPDDGFPRRSFSNRPPCIRPYEGSIVMELLKRTGHDFSRMAIYDNPTALACDSIPIIFLNCGPRIIVDVQREQIVRIPHNAPVSDIRLKILWRHTNVIEEVHRASVGWSEKFTRA